MFIWDKGGGTLSEEDRRFMVCSEVTLNRDVSGLLIKTLIVFDIEDSHLHSVLGGCSAAELVIWLSFCATAKSNEQQQERTYRWRQKRKTFGNLSFTRIYTPVNVCDKAHKHIDTVGFLKLEKASEYFSCFYNRNTMTSIQAVETSRITRGQVDPVRTSQDTLGSPSPAHFVRKKKGRGPSSLRHPLSGC